jgi:uncharacterized protein YndB with AHSA1/START domain
MAEQYIPTVEAQMLIRKPAATVFEAFIDPAVTTNFWFTRSSGQLETGKTVTWEWEMYGASTTALVKDIVPNKKITIEWNSPDTTTVDFLFEALTNDTTYVIIKNYGFKEEGNDLVEIVKNNTGGFTTVLDGAKAWLEHNLKLNLIGDKFANKKQ